MTTVGMVRLQKEIKMLAEEPPPGVCAWPVDDSLDHLQAQIQGPQETPYEHGTFLLDLQIPQRYPFEPPKVRFVTPIYHPNIDSGGRICLDTLKMRPAGSWTPSMNVPTLLTTIRLLMAHPNGDDGLMPEITDLFLKNPSRFADVARSHVEKHARQGASAAAPPAVAREGTPAPSSSTTDGKTHANDAEDAERRSTGGDGVESSAVAEADVSSGAPSGVAGSPRRRGDEERADPMSSSNTSTSPQAKTESLDTGTACEQGTRKHPEEPADSPAGDSSEDGAWSDSDDDVDRTAKRARTTSP